MTDTEQKPTLPPQPRARVYGYIPYEHAVIPWESLHPKLQELSKDIAHTRNLERTMSLFATLGLIAYSQNPQETRAFIFRAFFLYPAICSAALYAKRRYKNKITDDEDVIANRLFPELKGKEAINIGLKFLSNFTVPSVYSRILTYTAANVIKETMDKGEAPFADPDCSKLLHDYDVGMFDNKMNLVLIKHPESIYNDNPTEGPALTGKLISWHQPVQRPRFTINQPEIREKVKTPWLQRQLALSPGIG